ncbi:hypothetical protein H072_6735 [Dactylellina haptotyla CBS 200.50]|uniref:DUF6536 domain-containing protein n=1 Tax=Dactylellina haptotyla (strain CBS 200.50) TaxID=1284197 RepID=S8BJS5_DACHA|nr:hypothetical protein H072_6735 [Dactylellina haptotyla CBS 200.50]
MLNTFFNVTFPRRSGDQRNNDEADPSVEREIGKPLRKGKIPLTTWRVGAIIGAASTFLVLVINFTLLLVVSARDGPTLFRGDCNSVKKWSTAIHLLINIFATLLLGATNYSMQILMAPTRDEIDRAHSKGNWLDIGINSLRNMYWVGTGSLWRIILFLVLSLSSLPLHLLYNSTVYFTLQDNTYSAWAMSPTYEADYLKHSVDPSLETARMQPLECLQAYTDNFISKYSDIAVILNENATALRGPVQVYYPSDPTVIGNSIFHFLWICENWHPALLAPGFIYLYQSECDKARIMKDCIVTQILERCEVRFQRALMVAVILINLAKFLAIMTTVWLYGNRGILVTVGDACASFLENPDQNTLGRCLDAKLDFKGYPPVPPIFVSPNSYKPPEFKRRPKRWIQVVEWSRGVVVALILTVCLAIAGSEIQRILRDLADESINYLDIGFGQVDSRAVFNCSLGNYTAVILLANIPQLTLSIPYFLYNGIFTDMAVSWEFDGLPEERKYLRVSEPTGNQRKSFFLQLPYRFSIPLMVTSSLLHWLCSQSAFLVSISRWDGQSKEIYHVDGLGYSPIGLIATVSVFGAIPVGILFVGVLFGNRGIVPAVGSNSMAISAMCHPPPGDTHAATEAVMWGEVDVKFLEIVSPEITEHLVPPAILTNDMRHISAPLSTTRSEAIGHCCLTSFPVTTPIEGRLYQ